MRLIPTYVKIQGVVCSELEMMMIYLKMFCVNPIIKNTNNIYCNPVGNVITSNRLIAR